MVKRKPPGYAAALSGKGDGACLDAWRRSLPSVELVLTPVNGILIKYLKCSLVLILCMVFILMFV